jgi:hypothetical protein
MLQRHQRNADTAAAAAVVAAEVKCFPVKVLVMAVPVQELVIQMWLPPICACAAET